MNWQPIATAPRTEEELLLSCKEFVSTGFWSEEDGWIAMIWNGQVWALGFKPTHWMPLPEPPR